MSVTSESLHHYIRYRLSELERYSRELAEQASRQTGDAYRSTLGLIGDTSARRQELILLEGRFGGKQE